MTNCAYSTTKKDEQNRKDCYVMVGLTLFFLSIELIDSHAIKLF
jgi:hypothetical protein